jgi:hypothetical protein
MPAIFFIRRWHLAARESDLSAAKVKKKREAVSGRITAHQKLPNTLKKKASSLVMPIFAHISTRRREEAKSRGASKTLKYQGEEKKNVFPGDAFLRLFFDAAKKESKMQGEGE